MSRYKLDKCDLDINRIRTWDACQAEGTFDREGWDGLYKVTLRHHRLLSPKKPFCYNAYSYKIELDRARCFETREELFEELEDDFGMQDKQWHREPYSGYHGPSILDQLVSEEYKEL